MKWARIQKNWSLIIHRLLPLSVEMEDTFRAVKFGFKVPMDITQIIELVGVLKEQYGLPITDEAKHLLCLQVAEMLLVPTWEKGSKPIEVIGSTIAVGAFVFDLEGAKIFTAIPSDKAYQTVLEFVTQATVLVRNVSNTKNNNQKEASSSETKEINITIIVTP